MKKIGSQFFDKKINAENQMMECTIKEYAELVSTILENNEYQRRRVKSASSIYSLLKEDLKHGCVIPPIVMAYTGDALDNFDFSSVEFKNKLMILDGLQRSFSILDIVNDNDISSEVLDIPIRIELYTNINRMGILYRMLTLNTGQTRMSTRHQIEIIYSDYLNKCPISNVKFIKEVDDCSLTDIGQYKFRDVIEGFTSYIECDYLTLDRQDLLEQVKTLTKLQTEDTTTEIFSIFIDVYNKFVIKLNCLYSDQIDVAIKNPFGTNVIEIFNKSQSLTGFGAAIGLLQEKLIVTGLKQIESYIQEIIDTDISEGLKTLLYNLEEIRKKAKKIGNDQRLYFHYLYRKLFDPERDTFLSFSKSVIAAYKEYQRDVY